MEMEKLVSLCRRRGFLFQSSEIYGGINGFWDYGPLGVELKRTVENQSLAIAVDPRINDFFMETEQLPRVDHFWIGQSLWTDRLTWYEHTSAGYFRQGIDANGEQQEWAVEGRAPGILGRAGWDSAVLQPGETVTVHASPAKNGDPCRRFLNPRFHGDFETGVSGRVVLRRSDDGGAPPGELFSRPLKRL